MKAQTISVPSELEIITIVYQLSLFLPEPATNQTFQAIATRNQPIKLFQRDSFINDNFTTIQIKSFRSLKPCEGPSRQFLPHYSGHHLYPT